MHSLDVRLTIIQLSEYATRRTRLKSGDSDRSLTTPFTLRDTSDPLLFAPYISDIPTFLIVIGVVVVLLFPRSTGGKHLGPSNSRIGFVDYGLSAAVA